MSAVTGPTRAGSTAPGSGAARAGVELNGINVVAEGERRGRPSSLFWPWFAANASVLGVAYGAFVLAFGISSGQAALAATLGTVISFLLCGIVAVGGKRASAPTMVVSRAAFGVTGGRLPAALSWVLTVGWETVLVSLATLATATVLDRLGVGGGTGTSVVALVVVAALVIGAGILGFDAIMRLQKVITVVTAALTVVYVVLAAPSIDLAAVAAVPPGSGQAVLGALVFALTGFGLGWVNAAGDYSRYLPRSSSSAAVVGWTTLGGALAPVVLVLFGLLLVGSSAGLGEAVGADPVGALAGVLPTWFLVPFVVVVVLSLVGGAVLDIYSSGLALLSAGLPAPRWVAAAIDGALMVAGTVYVVFVAETFFLPFQGFLITLGVPIAAWCGIAVADLALRRRDYVDTELFDARGRYGAVNPVSVGLLVVGTVLGWGLVTNGYAGWLGWQGYLLGPVGLGGRGGAWAYANLGVLVALVVPLVGHLVLGRRAVRAQESQPAPATGAERSV